MTPLTETYNNLSVEKNRKNTFKHNTWRISKFCSFKTVLCDCPRLQGRHSICRQFHSRHFEASCMFAVPVVPHLYQVIA